MADVVVAEGVWGSAFDGLRATYDIATVPGGTEPIAADLLADARALVVRNRTQVDRPLLARAPRLEVVARAGVGLDNLDLPAIDEAGSVAVAALGANAASVAEHALASALAIAKGLVDLDRETRAGGWNRGARRELAGATWGLLSAGATARATGALARGLGMGVIAYDPYVPADDRRLADAAIELTSFDDVLARSDVLSIHLPVTAETTGLIDAKALARMKPDAILVNVSRGEVVDEDALVDALEADRLAGAALDVRASEPPVPGRLERAPRTLLTPHVAGITEAAQQRVTDMLCEELGAVLAGRAPTAAVGTLERPRPRSTT